MDSHLRYKDNKPALACTSTSADIKGLQKSNLLLYGDSVTRAWQNNGKKS